MLKFEKILKRYTIRGVLCRVIGAFHFIQKVI